MSGLLGYFTVCMGRYPRALAQWEQAWDWCRDFLGDLPLLTRLGSHVGLLALVVLSALIAQIPFRLHASADDSALSSSDPDAMWQDPEEFEPLELSFLLPSPLTVSSRTVRTDLTTYTVRSGDTVTSIAAQYGVSPDSILWANSKLEDNPDFLSLGQTLNIPPVRGVLYTVQNGDTVAKIVAKFKGNQSAEAMTQALLKLDFNQSRHDLQAAGYPLTAGQYLIVPGGSKPVTAGASTTAASKTTSKPRTALLRFGWPLAGRITQSYWRSHHAVDVAAPTGTAIRAANPGTVTFAGWDTHGYGNMVLISHVNGYITLYSHLSQFDVQAGTSVSKGQTIGRVGSTGHATGPHLHFEIRLNGVNQNPFRFLP